MARTQQEWEAIVGGGYTGTLGRTPDASEIKYWVDTAMNSGLGDQELINAFNNAAAIEIAGRTAAQPPATTSAPTNTAAPTQTFTSAPAAPVDPAPARSSADLEAIVRNAYGSSLARTPDQ
jgi:hypothetical protein